MSGAPPGDRFEHHGVPVETREQWAARAAAARAQEEARQRMAAARAEAEARQAAEAERRRVEAKDAEQVAAAKRERAAPQTSVLRQRLGLIAVLVLAGGLVVGLDALTRGKANSPSNDSGATPVAPPVTTRVATPSAPPVTTRVATPSAPTPPSKGPPRAPTVEDKLDVWGGLRGNELWSAAPGIDPEAAGWWCVCYKTRSGDDRTACRRLVGECTALREMIQTEGSSSILRGSATPNVCKFVHGPYPWIKLGHLGAWLPSAYSDAPLGDPQLRNRRRATQASVCAL